MKPIVYNQFALQPKVIWAMGRTQLLEFWRMRALVVIMTLLIGVMTIGLAAWLYHSDGRKDEQVQTFLSYSISGVMTLLSLFTIFLSIMLVTRDIDRKEIFTVLTKPVNRVEFLAGKFLGMCLINMIMLIFSGILIYGLAWYPIIANQWYQSSLKSPDSWKNKPLEPFMIHLDDYEAGRLRELVMVARQGVKPDYPDLTKEVSEQVEKEVEYQLKVNPEYHNNPELVKNIRSSLLKDISLQKMNEISTIPPNQTKVWKFSGINPVNRQNGVIVIRYKKEVSRNPEDLKTTDLWAFGAKDPIEHGGQALPPIRNEIRTFHEIPIPASEVSPDGELYLAYYNAVEGNGNVSVQFEAKDGLELLYLADSFENNFYRSFLLIFLRLVFLAALGTAMGAWLSYPVAVLLVMVVYCFGISSSFILDAAEWNVGDAYHDVVAVFLTMLPRFSLYDPVNLIQAGRLVNFNLLSQCLLWLIAIKGGIVAIFGLLVFKFRELARVIV